MQTIEKEAMNSSKPIEIDALEPASYPEIESAQTQDNIFKQDDESDRDPKIDISQKLEQLRILEAIIFASKEPLTIKQMEDYLPNGVAIKPLLEELEEKYQDQGFNLVQHGSGWYFRTAVDLSHILQKDVTEQRKLSRAALEILAIIAYHQPISRPEMEDIRGVSLSRGTLDVLLELGWIRTAGRREVPGRPLLYATTQNFLQHFGLSKLNDLPGLDELKAIGLLENRPGLPGLFDADIGALDGHEIDE